MCTYKKLNETSRECNSQKPQSTQDSKREKKEDGKLYKVNKQIHEKHIHQLSPSSPSEVRDQKVKQDWKKKREPRHGKTNKMTVRPEKTRISLGIRPVWSESSLCAHCVAKDQLLPHADSKDSDQTGFVMSRLK